MSFLSFSLLYVSQVWSMFDLKQCSSVRCVWIPIYQKSRHHIPEDHNHLIVIFLPKIIYDAEFFMRNEYLFV